MTILRNQNRLGSSTRGEPLRVRVRILGVLTTRTELREPLEAKLDRLRMSAPIEPVDVSIKDPERLRNELGSTFSYFGRVESEVAAEPLLVLMPRLGTEYGGYRSHGTEFLDIWVEQEHAHGAIFDRLQAQLGLQPATPIVEVTGLSRLAGWVGRLSSSLHAVFEMIYLSRGAMHEKLTFIGYQRMAAALENLDERDLLEGVIKPIRVQEAGHLAYYKQAARTLKAYLRPWQLRLARTISLMTYAPVGAGSVHAKADFGHVALALAGDRLEEFAAPIQAIAESLLCADEAAMPRFVLRSLNACVEAAEDTSRCEHRDGSGRTLHTA